MTPRSNTKKKRLVRRSLPFRTRLTTIRTLSKSTRSLKRNIRSSKKLAKRSTIVERTTEVKEAAAATAAEDEGIAELTLKEK